MCQQRGQDCDAAQPAGNTGSSRGTDFLQAGWDISTWSMKGQVCLHLQNSSVVSCALGVGKHHVEEHRGHLGGMRKLTCKRELVLAERG